MADDPTFTRARDLIASRLRDRNAEYLVRTLSRFTSLEDIETVMVGERDGQPIRLSDVAQIHRGHRERTTITHVDGRIEASLIGKNVKIEIGRAHV